MLQVVLTRYLTPTKFWWWRGIPSRQQLVAMVQPDEDHIRHLAEACNDFCPGCKVLCLRVFLGAYPKPSEAESVAAQRYKHVGLCFSSK
jgi:hypothetical protein